MHYDRWRKYGDPHITLRPQDRENPGYNAVHTRIKVAKGIAADHVCVDCGEPADHWSYDNAAPDEQIDPRNGMRYSLSQDHYQPRCAPCHTRFDAADKLRR